MKPVSRRRSSLPAPFAIALSAVFLALALLQAGL